MIQAVFWIGYMQKQGIIQASFLTTHWMAFYTMAVISLTAGCLFLMWLGKLQILLLLRMLRDLLLY